jgi:hypothetical protein
MPKGGSAYTNIRRGAEAKPVSAWFENGNKEPLNLYWGDRLEELHGDNRQTFEFIENTKRI